MKCPLAKHLIRVMYLHRHITNTANTYCYAKGQSTSKLKFDKVEARTCPDLNLLKMFEI